MGEGKGGEGCRGRDGGREREWKVVGEEKGGGKWRGRL
jgi:hypothetical protein